MGKTLTDSRLATLGAHALLRAFDAYIAQFEAITVRAQAQFEQCDWQGATLDTTERLAVYTRVLDDLVQTITTLLDGRKHDEFIWASMKAVYSSLIADRDDWEIAESFFNSLTRRIFTTVGVNQQIEFVDTDFDAPPTSARAAVYRTYDGQVAVPALIAAVLAEYHFAVDYAHLQADIDAVAASVIEHLHKQHADASIAQLAMITHVFYRRKGAYLIGRLTLSDGTTTPFVLALLNDQHGLRVDAVLLDEDSVAILFSFTRSYFRVLVERPYELVYFLKSIMPRKRTAELYTAIGYNKHGKTVFYRDLMQHLAESDDQFVHAPGIKGMVMLVFTLPSYDVVFKIIKDEFDYPKTSTRRDVMAKYQLVFQHDRAGRLIDAQEFEHLQIAQSRFAPALLDDLQRNATESVRVIGDVVDIAHVYVERRVTPLDVYVREADSEAAQAAVIEYGNAIKDLAATNIFPGDLLLKNFGVTRHGRVVFYDYDELCWLTDCVFRTMPTATHADDEFAAEPWFSVRESDIFPEELARFLGLQGSLRDTFFQYHADLFEATTWQSIQQHMRDDTILDIFPYHPRYRLTPNLVAHHVDFGG